MTAGDAAPVASGLWPGHRTLAPHGREGLREAPPGKCGLRGGAPGTPAPVWPIAEAAAGPGLPVTEVRAPGPSTRPAQWPHRPRGPPVAPSATGRPPGNPTESSASSPTALCPTRLCPTPRFSKGRGPRAGRRLVLIRSVPARCPPGLDGKQDSTPRPKSAISVAPRVTNHVFELASAQQRISPRFVLDAESEVSGGARPWGRERGGE